MPAGNPEGYKGLSTREADVLDRFTQGRGDFSEADRRTLGGLAIRGTLPENLRSQLQQFRGGPAQQGQRPAAPQQAPPGGQRGPALDPQDAGLALAALSLGLPPQAIEQGFGIPQQQLGQLLGLPPVMQSRFSDSAEKKLMGMVGGDRGDVMRANMSNLRYLAGGDGPLPDGVDARMLGQALLGREPVEISGGLQSALRGVPMGRPGGR